MGPGKQGVVFQGYQATVDSETPFCPFPPPFLSLFLCSQSFRSLLSSRNPILPSTNAHWLFCDQSLYGHGSVLCRHCRQGFHGAFSQQPAFCDSHGFQVTRFPAAIWPQLRSVPQGRPFPVDPSQRMGLWMTMSCCLKSASWESVWCSSRKLKCVPVREAIF